MMEHPRSWYKQGRALLYELSNTAFPEQIEEYMQTCYPGRKFHILSLGERFLLASDKT